MYCYCKKTFRSRDTELNLAIFEEGKYYFHKGVREMVTDGGLVCAFGKLDNWKEWFEEPWETRNRKLESIGI